MKFTLQYTHSVMSWFHFRSKFPAKTTQSLIKSPRGQEINRESPKQVPTRESPVKRDRMSPSATPMSLQQERRPVDRREDNTGIPTQRDNVTGTPKARENDISMSGRGHPSTYEQGLGLTCGLDLDWVKNLWTPCWICVTSCSVLNKHSNSFQKRQIIQPMFSKSCCWLQKRAMNKSSISRLICRSVSNSYRQ